MAQSKVETVCDIVSYLGGPSYSTSDLEWATEIAAGKNLIGWIAAQLDGNDPAALSRIALEDEEINFLKHIKNESKSSDLSRYIPPSRQSSRTTLADNNAYSLEQHVLLLQHRLKQTKILSLQLQKTAQTLKAELERVQSGISEKQEELEQLSIQADTTVSKIRERSLQTSKTLEDNLNLDDSSALLADCRDIRTTFNQNIAEQIDSIDAWSNHLPDIKELEFEVDHLQHALEGTSLLSSAKEAAYVDQLNFFLRTLQKLDGDDGRIYDFLQQVGAENGGSRDGLDVQKELESAWNLDQLAVLQARASVLQKASSLFQQTILLPLQDLNALLTEQHSLVRETLAVLGAFGEEMDEIMRELDTSMGQRQKKREQAVERSSQFESELKFLLKNLEPIRSSDSPPLVLLDQEDILTELRSLKRKEDLLNAQEEQSCSSIATALNSLMSTHEPMLRATYAHSPINTSPPYQLSPKVSKLQQEAKIEGDTLAAEVQRLQKNLKILDDTRTQRKLRAFVQQRNDRDEVGKSASVGNM